MVNAFPSKAAASCLAFSLVRLATRKRLTPCLCKYLATRVAVSPEPIKKRLGH